MITNLSVSSLSNSATSTPTGQPAAFANDVARFNQAMALPAEVAGLNNQTLIADILPANSANLEAAEVNSKPSLGDSIISGLQSASDGIHGKWASVTEALAGQELTITDALRLQMSVMQASVQYELMSKGISKTVQNLDQTLKTQ